MTDMSSVTTIPKVVSSPFYLFISFSALGAEYLLQVMTLYEDKSFVLILWRNDDS